MNPGLFLREPPVGPRRTNRRLVTMLPPVGQLHARWAGYDVINVYRSLILFIFNSPENCDDRRRPSSFDGRRYSISLRFLSPRLVTFSRWTCNWVKKDRTSPSRGLSVRGYLPRARNHPRRLGTMTTDPSFTAIGVGRKRKDELRGVFVM